jgi:hypothetical protein
MYNINFLFYWHVIILVGNTNSCISESNSNDCYNNCISDHWPGEQESTPTASWANGESSIRPTTTSTSYWSQSSGWPSIATWGPNSSGCKFEMNHAHQVKYTKIFFFIDSGTSPSAASTSAVHSGSSATYRMSKVVVGLSLAAAAYMLQ